ncbi:signal transduction histidine kinase [Pseudoduganella lurida]|uniref:histidine kinase n=1 Tax=Pseudoduganella lurida TaxID=1036180 RepID=A0A562RL57_9BURK|nr:ATP-binding protein [Pseudoduganella lurida]TWI69782.1 signal transduction histidine kinase [Pseudoduganella lurida]
MSDSIDFLSGGGTMGALIRGHDWTATSLGPPAGWPQPLKTVVRLLLTSNHPMFIWWGDDLVQFYNDSYSHTLGPERHPSALGARGRECWAEAWHLIGPDIESVMTAGAAPWYEDRLVPLTRNGQREDVWWTYGYSPIEDGDRVRGVLVICNDVTREHVSREGLRQSYDTLIQTMDEGFCVAQMVRDAAGRPVDYRFVETNRAFALQTGLDDANGRRVRELVPGIEQRWIDIYGEVAATGVARRFVEGSETMGRWFNVYASPVGHIDDAVALLFTDITEKRRAETALVASEEKYRAIAEAMAAANERKDEFLAMLAHELRNPLAPISSAAQILRMPDMGAPQVAHAAEVIGRQVRHMTELVDDLLDVSRVQRGLVELDCAPVDMKAAVQAAIEQARPLIERRGHVLVTRIASGDAVVLGDRKRLIQVAANLLTNAAKYTEPPGEITVTLHAGANEVRLDVADTGIGIEARLLPHIFDLFTQATRTPDRSQGGLGLGLALVRSLVGLHDGSVAVHSDGIGKGSVFTVRLPHHCAAVAREREPACIGSRNGASKRVLIVDDNVDGAEAMQQLLAAAGHAADVAHDADAALGNARPFDVYLLDIGLPGMSGHALAQVLRQRPGSAAAKLIAVSGYGQQQDIAASLAAGCDAHITKPADIGALLALIGSERPPT